MRHALLSCLVPLLFANPAAAARQTEFTQVYLSRHELNYIGYLDKDANQRLFALYDSLADKPTTLLIRSGGGEINTGMELGAWVHAHHLDVKVLEYCMSSCANYVFPAGARKTVSNFAVIGFHGGPSSAEFHFDETTQAMFDAMPKEQRDTMMAGFKADMAKSAAREAGFFDKIGVRQDITKLGHEPRYRSLMERDPNTAGWTYSLEQFDRFGVREITVINPPWKPVSADKSVSFVALPD